MNGHEEKNTEFLFTVWIVLLLPWLFIAPLLGMAFDAPPIFSIYFGVWSVWSYSVSIGIVWMFRNKHPLFALFPRLHLASFLIASSIH
jgi:hypothetical protein